MTEKEYLEKRIKTYHHYKVMKSNTDRTFNWNILKDLVGQVIKGYNMNVNDVKIKIDYDEEYGEIIISILYNEYETREETKKRLERQNYYKERAVESMKDLINRNKEEAIAYIKELGLV